MRATGCFVLLVIIFFSANAQKISFSEHRSSFHTYIKGDTFEGVVFSQDFAFPFLSHICGDKRFTPTPADIEAAEKLLINDLKTVNVLKLNQGGANGPVIHENLNRFVRQYYGYVTETGDRIVYISFLFKGHYLPKNKETPNWLKGAVMVLNGGSNYWQIQANLDKLSLFGLGVNGLDRTASR
ncbi:MAG: hypothetical protein H7Y13_05460 [Sphingobacteriaceae bacterium]|nr:hypothetical protein [Sphingobacteriaceae bacterium]